MTLAARSAFIRHGVHEERDALRLARAAVRNKVVLGPKASRHPGCVRAGLGVRFVAMLLFLAPASVQSASAVTQSSLHFSVPVRIALAPPAPGPGLPAGAEPRVAIGSHGRVFAMTTAAQGAPVVYRSDDSGRTWRQMAAPFAETVATPDLDIVVLPSGRVVATGLDEAAFQIIASYSDDSGATWYESTGTRLADQDRPWLAAGPHNRVYLLFHNLFSGLATENMFVSTSTDGGRAFGPPVPVTLPGTMAWSDLQCGASSGPWGIAANGRTGRVYIAWGARHARGGGCDAAATEGVGFSIVPADRLWLATSPDGSNGSWSTSLVVDDSRTHRSLGTEFTPPVVDAIGTVYAAYTETPTAYPNYDGAAVRYRWAAPSLSRWSPPITVVAGRVPGQLSVEAAAGASGRLDLAYFSGVAQRRGPPVWFTTAAVILHANGPRPSVTTARLAASPGYVGTATELSGVCGSGPTSELQQGLTCPRAPDDFGVALGSHCRLLVVWPSTAQEETAGTWAAHQVDGPTTC